MWDFWIKTSGTWVNALTVLLGTAVGLGLRGSLSAPMQQVMTQGLGLITLVIGIGMSASFNQVKAGPIAGIILGLLGMVAGGLLGEWWQLEKQLERLGEWLRRRVRGGGRFTEGFVAASLLFCVGPMALIGSFKNGLSGDSTLLLVKSTMDGIAAIAFTNSFGIGVGFSCLSIVLYQGGLSLAAAALAHQATDPATDPNVLLASGVGGLMIIGIGLNLLEVAKIRVASFLPALLLAPVLVAIAQWIGRIAF